MARPIEFVYTWAAVGMTITEKILAAHSGRPRVEPGEFISARCDVLMGNDGSVSAAIPVFNKIGAPRLFDPDRVVVVFDHFVPNKDIQAATLLAGVRRWAREQGIREFYDEGRNGIAHIILPEQGLVGGQRHQGRHRRPRRSLVTGGNERWRLPRDLSAAKSSGWRTRG